MGAGSRRKDGRHLSQPAHDWLQQTGPSAATSCAFKSRSHDSAMALQNNLGDSFMVRRTQPAAS